MQTVTSAEWYQWPVQDLFPLPWCVRCCAHMSYEQAVVACAACGFLLALVLFSFFALVLLLGCRATIVTIVSRNLRLSKFMAFAHLGGSHLLPSCTFFRFES